MNYGVISIDGMNLKSLWQTNGSMSITKDQIKLIQSEIALQMKGYGVIPKYNNKVSNKENEKLFNRYYLDYWRNTPGQNVEIKKQ